VFSRTLADFRFQPRLQSQAEQLQQITMSKVDYNLTQLCGECQGERADFRAGKTRVSPACVELFRRAFANDQAAWNAIFDQVFAQDIRQYVQAVHQEYIAQRGFAPFDPEDAEQETRVAFWRYAPQAATLLDSGQLEPIIAYLKKCAKSGAALAARRNRRQEVSLSRLAREEDNPSVEAGETTKQLPHPWQDAQFEQQLIERQTLLDELRKLVTVDPEPQQAEVVVIECFLNELPPRELLTLYPTLFAEIGAINTVLQRIRRRAKNQLYFQRMLSAAS
jgi:hypothetical protein